MYLICTERSDVVDNFVEQTLENIKVTRITAAEQNCMLSQGEKLTNLALDLMSVVDRDHMFFKNQQLELALVIFAPHDLEKINHKLLSSVSVDSVYFNDIDFKVDKSWMLGSVQAVLKILKSSDKILNLGSVKNGALSVDGPSGKYFQFPWFAHRVGLKVYDVQ